ncbi:MAG TPA: hypothetical protein VFE58_16870 [Tepidisphaeraceae bacterium]|jgi:hypothetical protein|nr:hypothetical protein [Tepidisphaeraceae bacterium]
MLLPPISPLRHRKRRRNERVSAAPPGPPAVHIVNLERISQTVLRFTFDVVIVDPGGCGDLRVADQAPQGTSQISDYILDAIYPDMANGNHWTAHVIDGEPIFADGAVLADDGGIVPVWA